MKSEERDDKVVRWLWVAVCVAYVLACGCVISVNAVDMPDGWVTVSDTQIYVDYPDTIPVVIYFNGVNVTPPDESVVSFDELGPGTRNYVSIRLGSPATVYDGDYTLPTGDYLSYFLLVFLALVLFYLTRYSWVFFPWGAYVSVSLFYFAQDLGHPWYFDMIGGFCFLTGVVIGVMLSVKELKKK